MSPNSSAAAPVMAEHKKRGVPQVVRNVMSNWGGYVFSIGLNFFVSPFVVHRLGDSAYGVWVLIVSLTGYLGLLDLGVRGAVTRYLAKFHAQGDHMESRRTVSSAAAVFVSAGCLAILVASSVAIIGVSAFHIPETFRASARVVLLISGVTVAISLIGGVFGGVVVGLQRFDLTNGVEVGSSILRSICVVGALYAGKGLITLALVQLTFTLLSASANALLSFRLYHELEVRPKYVDREHLKLIFSFSMYSFLLNVFGYLILYADAVLISLFLPVSMVTYFSIAGNLINYSRGLVGGISQTITPLASKMEAQGDSEKLKRVLLNGSQISSSLMFAIGITFLVRGYTFISLWMGPQYAPLASQILYILAVAAIIASGPQVAWALMFGISKHRTLVPVYLVVALANVGLSIFLIRKMGVIGTAWGTTVPDVIACMVFWPWYIRRVLGIRIRTYYRETWILPTIAFVPFAAMSYALDRWVAPHNLAVFFAQVVLTLPVGLVGFWYVCLSREARVEHSNSLRGTLHTVLQRG